MSKKTLDIIMPAYNAHKRIVKALSSIALQKIDFKLKVIIVDDGSKKDYTDEIKLFEKKLDIKVIRLEENQGVGVARQVGLDNSNGDYIVFMDSDDTFYDCISLQNMYWLMGDGEYDYAYGALMVEEYGQRNVYETHFECLLSTIISRKLIKTKKIKFNTTRSSEDNSFNHLCYFNANNINSSSNPLYIYKDSLNSLTRGINDTKKINNLCDYINNSQYVIDNIKNKFDYNIIKYFIDRFNCIWDLYSNLVKEKVKNTNKVLLCIKEFLKNNLCYTDEIIDNYDLDRNFSILRKYILNEM